MKFQKTNSRVGMQYSLLFTNFTQQQLLRRSAVPSSCSSEQTKCDPQPKLLTKHNACCCFLDKLTKRKTDKFWGEDESCVPQYLKCIFAILGRWCHHLAPASKLSVILSPSTRGKLLTNIPKKHKYTKKNISSKADTYLPYGQLLDAFIFSSSRCYNKIGCNQELSKEKVL